MEVILILAVVYYLAYKYDGWHRKKYPQLYRSGYCIHTVNPSFCKWIWDNMVKPLLKKMF